MQTGRQHRCHAGTLATTLLVFLTLLVSGCGGAGASSPSSAPSSASSPPVTDRVESGAQCTLGSEPVRAFDANVPGTLFLSVPSLSAYADQKYFATDFLNLLTIDFASGRIAKAQIQQPAGRETQPTAVYYVPSMHTLFLAEYLLNKVSVFSVDGDSVQFLFEFGGLVSPEGVVFDPATSTLFAAEFDGHAVSAWRVDMGARTAQLAWRQPVQYAHGITLARGQLFVTGLLDRKIHVFDPASGKPLRLLGEQGWDPWKLQFQWPTALDVDRDGNLIVSDADTGYVSVIDPDKGVALSVLGGAGPGRGRFSQPYASALNLDRSKLAVVSTKDERFLLLDYPSLCPRVSLYRKADRWQGFPIDVPVFHADGSDYHWTSGPRLAFLGMQNLYIYHAALIEESSGRALYLHNAQGLKYTLMYKNLQTARIADTDFLFSPYTYTGPVLVRQVGNSTYALDYPSSLGRTEMIANCWPYGGTIRCSQPEGYDLPQMLALTSSFIATVEAGRCTNGLVPLSTLENALRRQRQVLWGDPLDAPLDMAAYFPSATGQGFFAAYAAVDACSAPAGQVQSLRTIAANRGSYEALQDLSYRSVLVGSQ